MYILKIIGIIMIIISCSLIGHYQGSRYSKRLNNLRYIQNCIQLLETEIIYLSTPLPDAMENVFKKGNKKVSFIFEDIKQYLVQCKNTSVLESFNYVLDINKDKLNYTDEDIEILLTLGRVLGISDKLDQQKHIKTVLIQLRTQENQAEEKMKRNEPMFKKLGVLTGLTIAILLL